ncbi:MAG: glycosyl hydrolase family 65 protein [Kiritimatiellales bacterium]
MTNTTAKAGCAEWTVSESVYHPANERIGGTQFCIGNGLIGLRGSYEELGTREVQGLFAAGVFRKSIERQFCTADTFCRKKYIFNEELMPTPEEIYLIQNLPDPLFTKIWLDGKPFRMWDGKLLEYNRTLDLKTGTLTRTVRWDDGWGNITGLCFRRFCSMAERRLIAQEITITPENWSGEVNIESGIDASLNIEYAESVAGNLPDGLLLKSVVAGSGTQVFQCSENRLTVNGKISSVWKNETQLRRYKKIMPVQAGRGETLTLEKFSTVYSTQDGNPGQSALELAQRSAEAGFETCRAESSRVWQKIWEQADIQIEGDAKAQQRLRFALFHLIIASPQTDSRFSIGAKALTGQGYNGHVFWDTDINLAPFYQWVFPEWGGAHLRYRRRMLDDARAYAESEGRKGARYPWSCTVEGFEHAPVAITCSRTQIHVVPDIAYAALRYADITGDFQWLETQGKDVVTECARYMAGRVVFNAAQDRYEIHGVGGPDEYHPVTDNNAYTNYLTAYVLRRAAEFCPDKGEASRWREIADKMYCPSNEKTGLIPQCDGFYDLKDTWDVTGGEWGGPGAEYHECKGMKQPDVILLLTLLPEKFRQKHFQANWDYYERFILHGSSLSPSIHALVAAKLGLMDRAMHYFNLSADFDFVDYNNDTRDGIHIGNFGGLWQAVAYGFAGLELHGDELRFDPHLPPEWKSLCFRIKFRGNALQLRVTPASVEIAADGTNPSPVKLRIFGKTHTIAPGKQDVFR